MFPVLRMQRGNARFLGIVDGYNNKKGDEEIASPFNQIDERRNLFQV
jgi:hypothetical protein